MWMNMTHTQRLVDLGLLSGGVAHDLNNLLTGIMASVEIISKEADPGSALQRELDQLREAVNAVAGLTRQVVAYSHALEAEPRSVDLNVVVGEVGRMVRSYVARRADIVYDLAPALPVLWGHPEQLAQVILNLIVNAAEAVEGRRGSVRVRTGTSFPSGSDRPRVPHVFLEVSDQGCGIAAEAFAHIFEPFFSTKESGTGLGLFTVSTIVKGHGGWVEVDSVPAGGATFRVMLPVAEACASPAPPS